MCVRTTDVGTVAKIFFGKCHTDKEYTFVVCVEAANVRSFGTNVIGIHDLT